MNLILIGISLIALLKGSSGGRADSSLNFDVGTHFRNENIRENGDVDGEYGFRSPDGCMHVVRYEVRDSGYRVVGNEKRNCKTAPARFSFPKSDTSSNAATTRPFQRLLSTTRRPKTTTTTTPRVTTTRVTTPRITTPTARRTTTTARRTTTTARPRTPTKRKESPKQNLITDSSGKQLQENTGPPAEFLRPSILAPDDPDPEYSFGYETPTHAHTQVGLPGGEKKGKYWYDTPDGWRIIVTYEADARGFRPRVQQIRIPPSHATKGGRTDDENSKLDKRGEKRNEGHPGTVAETANGCPYYFYTNTRINYHWERCLLNGTRVGEYGKLGSDRYTHTVSYYADARGYRPKVVKTPLTPEQADIVAGFVSGAFIVPQIDEEKAETERRIREWIAQNQDKIERPL